MGYGKIGARRSNANSRLMAGLLASSAMILAASPALAQGADQGEAASGGQDIVVTGIRGTIQSSIEEKRDSDLIVEVLTSDEIGDIPALSIGEALETLTSAASHREQGGATEIALRGLGPFLSSTTINGRIASNGSGDRSVNFSQFPSELFNTLAIYKTQSASLIEGGVAGQIALETIAPLDYGRRRFQADIKIPYNPQNFDIDEDQRFRDFGHRVTLSYVDQYELGGLGDLGISIGYQTNRSTNPEQEANVSNTIRACVLDPTTTSDGVFDDGNCDTSSSTIDGLRDGSVTDDFIIARNSYAFRHNITDDERDSFFAAIQYQPSPTFEINADFQYANRTFSEQRSDLGFVEGRRIDGPGDPNRIDLPLIYTDTGARRQFTSEQRIEATSEYLERTEDYYGGGIDIALEVSDRLTVTADVSYSETQRIEEAVQVRFRTEDNEDITGAAVWPNAFESDGSSTNDRVETAVQIMQNGSQALNFFTQNFDVTNHDLFANDPRVRADLEQDRFNSVWAVRADAEYELDGFLSSIMVGARFQDLVYRDVPGAQRGTSRFENSYNDTDDTGALAAANRECRTSFPSTGFLSSVSGSNPLITNLDENGAVIGTANSYATFDALCIVQVLEREDPSGLSFDANGVPIFPTGEFESIQNSDVTERSWAGYVQANFNGDLGSTPVRGNFGLRVVHTEVESIGFRASLFSVVDNSDPMAPTVTLGQNTDDLTTVTGGGSYTEYLPSFNFTAELTPDLLGRVAVYRAMSRPDPSELGFGRSFPDVDDSVEFATLEEAIGVVTAVGNPFTDPLMSWNGDVSLEWYPNEDTIVAASAYYKSFNGGFQVFGQNETFNIDGQDVDALVRTVNTIDETNTIYGFELSVAHRLSYLPQPLDGLGFKVGYNYASSDFEFEDDTLGVISSLQDDGSITSVNGLIAPSNIFGLSEHVLSAQVYYQIGDLDLQGVYKYRSNYFQQFVSTPGRVRYVDDTSVFEARISYSLTDNVTVRLEGINLFNEPRVNYRGAPDDLGAVQLYGPRYFAGVRFKF